MDKQQITTYNKERAIKLTELLLECGYVCMLSKEEGLFVINFIETFEGTFNINEDNEANRNGVVFMSRDEFEEKYFDEKECDGYCKDRK